MSKGRLTYEDYQHVLSLAQNQNPLWTMEARERVVAANLIMPSGELTDDGKRKADKLAAGLANLHIGIPLSHKRYDRSDNLWKDQWTKVKVDGRSLVGKSYYEYAISRYALFMDRLGIDLPGDYIDISETQYRKLRTEITASLNTKAWYKLEPIGIQLDRIGGLECIYFRSITTHNKILRIQSKYFDFANKIYGQPSFWYRAPSESVSHPPIAIKYAGNSRPGPLTKGLKNGIIGLVMPVTGNWPEPQFGGISND